MLSTDTDPETAATSQQIKAVQIAEVARRRGTAFDRATRSHRFEELLREEF
jgi:hypothetical protein